MQSSLADDVLLELLSGCVGPKRAQDVRIPIELAEEGPVGRFLVLRRTQLVELLDGFLVDREEGAEVAGGIDGVRGAARDLRDRPSLRRADLRRAGRELVAREAAGSASAGREREDACGECECGPSHVGARSSTRSDGVSKPKRR